MKQQRLENAEKAWNAANVDHLTVSQIAERFGWRDSDGRLRRGYTQRMIADYGRQMAQNIAVDGRTGVSSKLMVDNLQTPENALESLLGELHDANQRIAELEAAQQGMYEPSARDDTDWTLWEEEYKRLSYLDRLIVVMTMNDLHIPDDDEQAVELWFQIYALALPDVVIFGSDAFDFDVLSLKYKRMYNRRRVDPFAEVQPRYDDIVTRMKAINPKVIIIGLGDNHAQIRLENIINELFAVFGDRLTADYNELIRSQNRVLWLGWQQEVYMGKAIFEHGKRAGANPAMGNFKAHGESFSDVSGHAHRYQLLVSVKQMWLQEQRRMLYYPLVSAVTGTLQHIPPHYITDTKAVNSTQGCSVSHVNLHGLDTHVQNVLFHPRVDGSLVAVYGSQVFLQPALAEAADGKAA